MAQRRGTRAWSIRGGHGSHLTDPRRDRERSLDIVALLAGPDGPPPPRQRPLRTPCVYFVQSGEHVKIGTTLVGAAQRFRAMQLPPGAQLIAVIDGADRYDEERLHRMFHKQRVSGEWFERCPELDALIAAHAVEPLSR